MGKEDTAHFGSSFQHLRAQELGPTASVRAMAGITAITGTHTPVKLASFVSLLNSIAAIFNSYTYIRIHVCAHTHLQHTDQLHRQTALRELGGNRCPQHLKFSILYAFMIAINPGSSRP